MNYQELNGKSIRQGFTEFNNENPHIYKAFEEKALIAIAKGKTKISAKLIINTIRWDEFLNSTDKSFKINDAYQAYYAREFISRNPQHENVFNLRMLRNESSKKAMNVKKTGKVTFN